MAEEKQKDMEPADQDMEEKEIAVDAEADEEAKAEEIDQTDNLEEEEDAVEEKKGLFGKKKEKKDKKTQQIDDLTDRLMRTMAEFDNFRKRTEKEKSFMYENGARSVIEKVLPVVDNFERAFKDINEEQLEDPFIGGMDKVFKQLMSVFEEIGVKAIEAEGQPFNPDFHNAVMHVEDEEQEENVIVEEFQKGYMYKETVVRHSMVKVAN